MGAPDPAPLKQQLRAALAVGCTLSSISKRTLKELISPLKKKKSLEGTQRRAKIVIGDQFAE